MALVKYIGTASREEYPITGTYCLWQPGQKIDVSDARKALLLASSDFGVVQEDIIQDGGLYAIGDDGVASEVGGAGRRTTPVRVVTFGDSTANYGNNHTATDQDTAYVTASTWNSGLTNNGLTHEKMQLQSKYPMAWPVGNCGISGQTTAQMLARDDLAASITRRAITDALNLNPDVVIYLGGSINNLLGVTSGTVAATVASTYAEHVSIISRFLAAGVAVIDVGIYGIAAGASGLTDLAACSSAIVQLNSMLNAYHAGINNTLFVDSSEITHNGYGVYLPYMSTDAVHLNAYGQSIISDAIADALTTMYGVSSNIRYPGYNNFANSLMTASSTAGGYGPVATNVTIAATAATRANAKIEPINGGNMQTVEITTTGAGSCQMGFVFDPSSAGAGLLAPLNIVSGDIYGFESFYYIERLSGSGTLTFTSRLDIRDNIGGGRVISDVGGSVLFNMPVGGRMYGKLIHNPLVFGDSQANLLNTTIMQTSFSFSAAGDVFKIGVGGQRCVKQ